MGGAKRKGKNKVFAVHLRNNGGDEYVYCLEAKNVEHLFNLLYDSLEDELVGCECEVAILGGSPRINSETTLKLGKLVDKFSDDRYGEEE